MHFAKFIHNILNIVTTTNYTGAHNTYGIILFTFLSLADTILRATNGEINTRN